MLHTVDKQVMSNNAVDEQAMLDSVDTQVNAVVEQAKAKSNVC